MEAKSIVRMKNGWLKSHGLGNDYIVFDANNIGLDLNKDEIIRICNRNYGIGSDGILLKTQSQRADFGLRIYNPDGSEAEKSGNGIRIYADYLYNMGFTEKTVFTVEVGGEIVGCEMKSDSIAVNIGKATFVPAQIPLNHHSEEVTLMLEGRAYVFTAVSVGNPHAVCIVENLEPDEVKRLGPMVENHAVFPNRTNVQFAKIIDRHNVAIEIWERGAGYTLASGSSSCGVVAVLFKKGLVDGSVSVHMPGGTLQVHVDDDFRLRLEGPVTEVACGILL